jgi:DNA-binding CsgD family transcriptional regulator/PAS domain-containing protein
MLWKTAARRNLIGEENRQILMSLETFRRYRMAGIRHGEATHREFFGGVTSGKLRGPLAGTLSSVTSLLRNSTIGVALFDGNLHCRALNGALRRTIGGPPKRHIGKQLHQVFPAGAPKLEIAFGQVWTTGNSVSNLELIAQLRAGTDPRHWLMNFYPITDESGQIRLVAITLCEVTKGRGVEVKLSRLRDKFQSHVLRQPDLLEEEFSEVSAQTFELVNRSVALLKSSLSLRFYTSETQLETALGRHELYMTANRVYETELTPTVLRVDSDPEPKPSPGTPNETDPLAGSPSPRERQVLRLLADGKSSKEIGFILHISTRTVEFYRARIMLKLDLHSTAALVRYAIRNNIVEA